MPLSYFLHYTKKVTDMIYKSLAFIGLIFTANISFASCMVSNDNLGAVYKVTTTHSINNTESVRHLVLWRSGRQVAHEYLDTHMTEVWERMSNQRLRMTNYFDDEKRGIEYQPDEIRISHNENDWLLKKQLITNDLIQSMQLVATAKKGCDSLVHYVLKTDEVKIELHWLVKQELAKQYKEESGNIIVTWQLEKVIDDPEEVKNTFLTRSDYQTTDYTDIGDNESDPFLLKMINLGFIAHTASGVYDAQGNSLELSHQH